MREMKYFMEFKKKLFDEEFTENERNKSHSKIFFM